MRQIDLDRADVLREVCHSLGIALHVDKRGRFYCEPPEAVDEHPELFVEIERHRWAMMQQAGFSKPVLYMLWVLGYF